MLSSLLQTGSRGPTNSSMASAPRWPGFRRSLSGGKYPKELASLGMRQFRQVHHKPYRMNYQVGREAVTVFLIADGRRDMQALLQRRLLSG